MKPVRITIEGNFWDSQIYASELTLFGADGTIHRINWAWLIDELARQHSSAQTAIRVAFADGELFYMEKVQKMLRDPSIENIVKQQLDELAALCISGSQTQWNTYWQVGATPFDFLPTDTDIYYYRLFASGDDGVYSTSRSASTDSQGRRSIKHHDGRVLQIKASNQNTAVAAAGGADGLFELTFNSKNRNFIDRTANVTHNACNACDWAFESIIAWSDESAFFARFRENIDPQNKRKKLRTFDTILSQEQIFGEQRLRTRSNTRVWGSHEKLFCISSEGLEILDYTPPPSGTIEQNSLLPPKSDFASKGQLNPSKLGPKFDPAMIIATGTAPFGTVLEYATQLVVLRSDGGIETFEGEPVHWRVFPRSEHYSNQLHIIYEDSVVIVSFVHDYFIDQEAKLLGFAKGDNEFIV